MQDNICKPKISQKLNRDLIAIDWFRPQNDWGQLIAGISSGLMSHWSDSVNQIIHTDKYKPAMPTFQLASQSRGQNGQWGGNDWARAREHPEKLMNPAMSQPHHPTAAHPSDLRLATLPLHDYSPKTTPPHNTRNPPTPTHPPPRNHSPMAALYLILNSPTTPHPQHPTTHHVHLQQLAHHNPTPNKSPITSQNPLPTNCLLIEVERLIFTLETVPSSIHFRSQAICSEVTLFS